MATVIRQQLSLVIHLIDTTTGSPILQRNVQFIRDGTTFRPMPRGNGIYVVLNEAKINFTLMVDIYGYEVNETYVDFGQLDSNLPVLMVFMIPKENTFAAEGLRSLQGVMPGISSLEAVPLYQTQYYTRGYDERKRIIKLNNPHQKLLTHVYYGVIRMDLAAFEKIEVEKQISSEAIQLRKPLENGCEHNSALSRIVYGKVDAKGNYLLRVRDDASALPYLVRFVVDDREFFQNVNFHEAAGFYECLGKERKIWDSSR